MPWELPKAFCVRWGWRKSRIEYVQHRQYGQCSQRTVSVQSVQSVQSIQSVQTKYVEVNVELTVKQWIGR